MMMLCNYTGVDIISGPVTVPNAILGGIAQFECVLNDEYTLARWNINDVDYSVTSLPLGYYFDVNSFTNILIVNPVREEHNNTCVYCYVRQLNNQRSESSRAKLIIQVHMSSSSIWEVTTTTITTNRHIVATSIITSTVSDEVLAVTSVKGGSYALASVDNNIRSPQHSSYEQCCNATFTSTTIALNSVKKPTDHHPMESLIFKGGNCSINYSSMNWSLYSPQYQLL